MKKTQSKIGPVQLLAIGFTPEAKFEGKIIKELEKLDRTKTIRILDLLFVQKDKKTNELIVLSIQEEDLGAIVGALMGFDFEDIQDKTKTDIRQKENNAFGLSLSQIENIGNSLEPGMAAALLLIEHVWARDLKQAIRENGGFPIAEGFLTPESLAKVFVEVEAMSEMMDEMEKGNGHHITSSASM